MKLETRNRKNPPRPATTPPKEGNVVEKNPTPENAGTFPRKKSPSLEGCRNGGVGSPVLKYSSHLTPFAKKLRTHMTLAEVLLWKKLNRRQMGVRFNRQKPIGKWVVDFYCKELQLAVEVDGNSHNFKKADDGERQKQLESLGLRFLRFWDSEVKNEIGSVVARIEAWIRENPPRPPATPPKEGNVVEKNPTPESAGTFPRKKSPPLEGCRNGGVGQSAITNPKSGSALVVVLWVLLIVALIVSSFAFEMQLESRMITMQRKRFKADQLALAGVEMARAMLAYKEEDLQLDSVGTRIPSDDPWVNEAAKITNAIPINYTQEFGGGTVTVHIDYEEGRRNISKMTRDDWRLMFEQAGIPNTEWDAMLDCLDDWQDENDLHMLNGAESDDPFYKARGYECKNAPVDTVDELLLIKNWGEEVLYGTPPDEADDHPIAGIANLLTTWGSGRVNPNSASLEVLNSLQLSEEDIAAILELRLGLDGEANTADDGITEADLAALGGDAALFTLKPDYVSISSVGEVGGLQSQISCIFRLGDKESVPLFWLEGKIMEK